MILSVFSLVAMTHLGALAAHPPSATALAARFVQVQAALPGEQPTYAGWSRGELLAEVQRLEDARPGIGGPIAMITIGACIGVVDLIAFLFVGLASLLNGNTGFAPGFTIGVSVVGVLAVGLLIVGVILLRGISKERADLSRQIETVKAAIQQLIPAPNEPRPNVPERPAPFLQVRGSTPLIAVTLARF